MDKLLKDGNYRKLEKKIIFENIPMKEFAKVVLDSLDPDYFIRAAKLNNQHLVVKYHLPSITVVSKIFIDGDIEVRISAENQMGSTGQYTFDNLDGVLQFAYVALGKNKERKREPQLKELIYYYNSQN